MIMRISIHQQYLSCQIQYKNWKFLNFNDLRHVMIYYSAGLKYLFINPCLNISKNNTFISSFSNNLVIRKKILEPKLFIYTK